MRKRSILVILIVAGCLSGYFLYLYFGGTLLPLDTFETSAEDLCTPTTTATFEEETVIVYMCKNLHTIKDGLILGFLFTLFMSVSFILGFYTGKPPKGVKK